MLNAVIICYYLVFRPLICASELIPLIKAPYPVGPVIPLLTGDILHEVQSFHGRGILSLLGKTYRVRINCRDYAVLGPYGPYMLSQRPGVNPFYADDIVVFHEVVQAPSRPPVAGNPAPFLYNESFHPGPGRLKILVIYSVVPDMGIGHCHD